MNIEQVEKEAVAALSGLAEVIKAKTEELSKLNMKDLLIKERSESKFSNLTIESQQLARELLAELIKDKYKNTHDLPDGTVKYLGSRLVEALHNLENDKPEIGGLAPIVLFKKELMLVKSFPFYALSFSHKNLCVDPNRLSHPKGGVTYHIHVR